MKYTPEKYAGLPDVTFEDIGSSKLFPKWVLRGFRVSELSRIKGDELWLTSDSGTSSLVIPSKTEMRFGSETVSAIEYSKRVLERGDFIDAIINKQANDILNAEAYWIQIRYRDQPDPRMKFRRKDDGLFAMRAKAGEKAERIVASKLMTQSQHTFASTRTESPGFFEITYANKKVRKPDLICQSCGLRFEVKKRNRDFNFRISHSRDRPFSGENNADDWHAFVFPDNTVRFVKNREIILVIQSGRAIEGSDRYDTWADVNEVKSEAPPLCNKL